MRSKTKCGFEAVAVPSDQASSKSEARSHLRFGALQHLPDFPRFSRFASRPLILDPTPTRTLESIFALHTRSVKMPSPELLPNYVYKILDFEPPSPIPKAFPPSELDKADGFIHLSIASQVSQIPHAVTSSHRFSSTVNVRSNGRASPTRSPSPFLFPGPEARLPVLIPTNSRSQGQPPASSPATPASGC